MSMISFSERIDLGIMIDYQMLKGVEFESRIDDIIRLLFQRNLDIDCLYSFKGKNELRFYSHSSIRK